MNDKEIIKSWIKRAKSNLEMAKAVKLADDVYKWVVKKLESLNL